MYRVFTDPQDGIRSYSGYGEYTGVNNVTMPFGSVMLRGNLECTYVQNIFIPLIKFFENLKPFG